MQSYSHLPAASFFQLTPRQRPHMPMADSCHPAAGPRCRPQFTPPVSSLWHHLHTWETSIFKETPQPQPFWWLAPISLQCLNNQDCFYSSRPKPSSALHFDYPTVRPGLGWSTVCNWNRWALWNYYSWFLYQQRAQELLNKHNEECEKQSPVRPHSALQTSLPSLLLRFKWPKQWISIEWALQCTRQSSVAEAILLWKICWKNLYSNSPTEDTEKTWQQNEFLLCVMALLWQSSHAPVRADSSAAAALSCTHTFPQRGSELLP